MENPGVIDRNQIIYGGQLGFKLQSKLSSNVKNSLFTPVNKTKITPAIIKKLHNKYCLIHRINSDIEVKIISLHSLLILTFLESKTYLGL